MALDCAEHLTMRYNDVQMGPPRTWQSPKGARRFGMSTENCDSRIVLLPAACKHIQHLLRW